MRLGVLDIGSNTGHLLVVDAHGGAAPLPAYSYKEPLRLAEHLVTSGSDEGAVSQTGIDALTAFTAQALVVAEDKGCEDMLGFATSAVRDSVNSDDGARPRPRQHRRADPGAVRRGRGPAHLPRRTPLVRVVGRSAGRLRHRRRIAGDRRRRQRVAGRRVVAAPRARRGWRASSSAVRVPTTRRFASSASRFAPRSPVTPATCCAPARRTAPPRRRRRSGPSPASVAPRPRVTDRWSRGA